MCIAAIAWKAHPRWLLMVAGNRDELHDRPAAPLARWDDDPAIIAGRDLVSGGSWMGIAEHGRFALVTNRRGFGTADPALQSRGALVSDILTGKGEFAAPDSIDLNLFNPFNLVTANPADLRFFTNRPEPEATALPAGVYGLSNGALDEPWPKTLQLKSALLQWLADGQETPDLLVGTLGQSKIPADGLAPETPSDIPQEPDLSPVFIRHPVYGTRCSTVIAIDAEGRGTFIERRFDAEANTTGETRLEFSWG